MTTAQRNALTVLTAKKLGFDVSFKKEAESLLESGNIEQRFIKPLSKEAERCLTLIKSNELLEEADYIKNFFVFAYSLS